MPNYSRDHIHHVLSQVPFASMATHREGQIAQCMMGFACDQALRRCFLLTLQGTRKVSALEQLSRCSMMVFQDDEDPTVMSQTQILGEVEIKRSFDDPEVQEGLTALSAKLPQTGMIQKSGSLGDYVILVLRAKEVSFSVYAELLDGVPPTVLRFDQ